MPTDYLRLWPANSLRTGADIRRAVLERIKTPQRLSVVDASKRYMRVSTPGGYDGPWNPDIAPYMCEPMNACVDRNYEAVVFIGVAQSGKTASLAEGLITYSIAVDPSDISLIMPSGDSARDFSRRRLDRMLRNSPELAKRVGTGHDDNVFAKVTLSGAIVAIGWPTVSQLASKNLKRIILSDLDRMPLDVGGEGDPFSMARKRTQSFMSAGKVIAETTPGFEIVDRDWEPPSPDSHEAPPVAGGALALYNQGTRERFYWTCPHCESLFRAEMQHFRWEELPDPLAAAATAHVVCPHCGVIINESEKHKLNLGGRWLAEGALQGEPRTARWRTFWMQGVAAAFQKWDSLAYNMIVARREYADTGNTERLKTVTNVDWGLPFLPASVTAERSATALAALAEPYALKVAPKDSRFLIASVDVQKNRFVVQVVAHGQDRERWVIDRFNITESPRLLNDGANARVSPFEYQEDYEALMPLITSQKYAHELGGELGIKVVSLDTGGVDEATSNSYKFWRKCAGLGVADKLMLIKGNGSPKVKRLTRSSSQKVDAVPVWIVATNTFKTEVSHDLARPEAGPGKLHLSSMLEPWFFDELAAEEQEVQSGKWIKKNAKGRNEAFDLLVYDAAALTAIGGEGIDWSDEKKVPLWAKRKEQEQKTTIPTSAPPVAPTKTSWASLAQKMNN